MTPEYHEIAKLKELPNGSAMRVEVDGVEVALVHTEGQVYAIDDVCSHAEVSLSEGEVEGCFIECWLHGSRFDVRTGEPTGPPAVEPVPTYSARVDGTGDDAVIFVAVNKGVAHTWQN
ncbi:MAG: non-heme iron oxygenase ferredoxin subunit [Candidatus Nanopelagicales bacterium]